MILNLQYNLQVNILHPNFILKYKLLYLYKLKLY